MNTIRYRGKCLMNYKISVIVATYNSGDFLNEFLEKWKSYTGLENSSKKETAEMLTGTFTVSCIFFRSSGFLCRGVP